LAAEPVTAVVRPTLEGPIARHLMCANGDVEASVCAPAIAGISTNTEASTKSKGSFVIAYSCSFAATRPPFAQPTEKPRLGQSASGSPLLLENAEVDVDAARDR
jgi:hypothetical protein